MRNLAGSKWMLPFPSAPRCLDLGRYYITWLDGRIHPKEFFATSDNQPPACAYFCVTLKDLCLVSSSLPPSGHPRDYDKGPQMCLSATTQITPAIQAHPPPLHPHQNPLPPPHAQSKSAPRSNASLACQLPSKLPSRKPPPRPQSRRRSALRNSKMRSRIFLTIFSAFLTTFHRLLL